MTRDLRTVIFDVGGVLLDWDPRYLYRRLLPDEAAVERFLAEICTPTWNAEVDRGWPWAAAVAERCTAFPDHAELITAYDARWSEMVAGPIEGTVAILQELRGGPGLYALTNFSTPKFAQVRAEYPFLSWFAGIVVSAEERLIKPDPRLYQVLFDRHGLDPAAAVYIDDSVANVTTARELGMTGLHFTGPEQLREDLTQLGLLPARATSITGAARNLA